MGVHISESGCSVGGLMFAMSMISWSPSGIPVFYILSIGSLLAGDSWQVPGARRWIDVGGCSTFNRQVGEACAHPAMAKCFADSEASATRDIASRQAGRHPISWCWRS